MRISKELSSAIVQYVQESFGQTNVYLFGSRVDDDKIGGDIDIAVENSDPRSEFRKKKACFYAMLYKNGYEIKIDLVQYSKESDTLIAREIEFGSVLLSSDTEN